MTDFISKDLQKYMADNNLRFTDFETAGLIYNSPLLPEEKYKRLEALAAETDDEKLKEQIKHRLRITQEDNEAFQNGANGYVYVVNSYEFGAEPAPCGYFAGFEPAYEYGKKLSREFGIEKYRIVGYNGIEPLKSKAYNAPMSDNKDDKGSVSGFESDFQPSDGDFRYDKNGVLTSFYCASELRDDNEMLSLFYDADRFENAFIFIPNPFEYGDMVKCPGSGKLGIVMCSHKMWDEFLERVRSGEFRDCGFADASIIVDIPQADGTFSHTHINPAFLEKYEPTGNDEFYDILTEASALCKGNGSFEAFTAVLTEKLKAEP